MRKHWLLGNMNNFRMLFERSFWIKFLVISWWSIVVGSYVWFLGFVGKTPLFEGWLSVVAATLIGGAGMNHLTNLYNTSRDDFTIGYVWPVVFVSLGAILLVFGVFLTSLHKETWVQVLAIVYVIIALIVIVIGSDSAPRN